MNKLKVGSVIILTKAMLGNESGTIGVVYEEYNLGWGDSISIIFPNGNYDGFSPEEQYQYLQYVEECPEVSNYVFTNVIQLSRDFDKGRFNIAFKRRNE